LSNDINITIAKTDFTPNEVIDGTITIKLDKPIKSKGVFVSLTSGETKPGRNSKGQSTTVNYTHIWSSIPLDGEKEYPAGQSLSYSFRFTAPSRSAPVSLLSMVWKGAKSTIKDYNIDAKLDISMGFDVNTKKEIKIAYS
jgi:hypothetical protein